MIFTSGEGQVLPFLSLGYAAYLYDFACSEVAPNVVDNALVNPYISFDFGNMANLQKLMFRVGWLQSLQNDRFNVGKYVFPCGGEFVAEVQKWDVGIKNDLFVGVDMMPYYNTVDPAGYKYVLDLTIEDGEKLHIEYVGPAKLINSSDEGGLCSNLDRDVNVPELTQASMFCVGDILEDGATETWVISIGDEHYDLLTDYGPGYSMLLYFNLEPGLSGVPAGTYSDFIDPLTAVEMVPNTMLGGLSMYGMYMGCFYMCPALTEEAALSSGSVTVAVDGNIYTITGTLYDGYENKVTFSYEGEVEKMVYEPYSVKSTSKSKGMLSKRTNIVRRTMC
jgi:hypothetical protein